MTLLDQTIDHLGRLVAYPTVSSDSNLAMIHDLAERLEGIGARVEVMADDSGAKANLWATLGPDEPGGVVLSGHTDVVPTLGQVWQSDPFVLTEVPEGLAARGACDMKGFIACCLSMAPRLLAAATERPVHFAFTYDEETGCFGGQALMEALRARGLRPGLAIIGEPTSMQVIDGHKGCCEYTARIRGKAGHGSAPGAGVNAVGYAVRYAARLQALEEDLRARMPEGSPFDPPWSTINIGRLSGGQAHNVIPEEAEIDWEMRPVQWDDALYVKARMAAYVGETLLPAMRAVHPGADIETVVVGEVPGLEPRAENPARDVALRLTGGNRPGTVAFGTEAGLYQELGIPTVVCGPGSITQAHTAGEWIARDQIEACLAFLGGLCAVVGGQGPG